MIRATLLRLLGFAPRWEVRRANTARGRDLPGTKLFAGSYREARRAYRAYDKAHAQDHTVRLQAVLVTAQRDVEGIAQTTQAPATDDVIASNARQNETMRRLQDEPNRDVEYEEEHTCDDTGPLKWDESGQAYAPSCSVCGRLN